MNILKLFTIALSALLSTSTVAQQVIPAKVIINHKAVLGEGSIWHPRENILYWVDIDNGILNTFDPVSLKQTNYNLGQKVGTVVPIDTGGVLVALKDGIYSFNLKTQKLNLLCSPEKDKNENRFNDGKCDPAGRFWVGSMGSRYNAALYRISSDGNYIGVLDSITISNGIVWTSDKKTMYYADTSTGYVQAFDYDNQTGNISNRRIVIRFPQGAGYPDGMTIDSEDKLWIAHWGGYCIGRWDPLTGKMLTKVEVPAPNVTSCAFGGKNLDILYITTASTGMNESDREKYPDSGKVFTAKPGVKGVKANLFSTNN